MRQARRRGAWVGIGDERFRANAPGRHARPFAGLADEAGAALGAVVVAPLLRTSARHRGGPRDRVAR